MIIVGCFLLMVFGGVIWSIRWDDDPAIPVAFTFFGVLGLLVCAFSILAVQLTTRSEIQEFYAVQETVSRARVVGRELELAAYQTKVAEANQWLARAQYWNGTVFNIWWPDQVEELEPIR